MLRQNTANAKAPRPLPCFHPPPHDPTEPPNLLDPLGNHYGRNPQIHRSLPSAAELAADDSLRPHHSLDHREDRLGVADPSLHSDAREEPPFVGDDRRTPRLCSGREEEGWGTGQT